jgi:hypothetical protein
MQVGGYLVGASRQELTDGDRCEESKEKIGRMICSHFMMGVSKPST